MQSAKNYFHKLLQVKRVLYVDSRSNMTVHKGQSITQAYRGAPNGRSHSVSWLWLLGEVMGEAQSLAPLREPAPQVPRGKGDKRGNNTRDKGVTQGVWVEGFSALRRGGTPAFTARIIGRIRWTSCKNMASVQVSNVILQGNPAKYTDEFNFHIRFEAIEDIRCSVVGN